MSNLIEIQKAIETLRGEVQEIKQQEKPPESNLEPQLNNLTQTVGELKETVLTLSSGGDTRHKESDLLTEVKKLVGLQREENNLLSAINERQKKESFRGLLWSFATTIVTIVIMGGLAYLSIHLELFDKNEVRLMLMYVFNSLFGA